MFAVLAGLASDGYAEVRREGRNGPGSRVILLRARLPLDQVRARLDADAPFALVWEASESPGRGCRGADCPARVGVEADGLLRIELGVWPRGQPAAAEAVCGELVTRRPRALEVSAQRVAAHHGEPSLALPLRRHAVVHAVQQGVLVERVERLPSAEVAQLVAETELRSDWLSEQARVGTLLSRVRRGAELHSRVLVYSEELELAAGDTERRERAERYAAALAQLVPDAHLSLDRVEPVLRQAALLQVLREASGAAAGAAWRARSQAMLQRALVRHPDDPRIARALAALGE